MGEILGGSLLFNMCFLALSKGSNDAFIYEYVEVKIALARIYTQAAPSFRSIIDQTNIPIMQ